MRKKYNQIGRSMVEMLGVLAIIGVLSVGGITGYSKAMMKYKLNKHTESFNQFIISAIELKPQLNRSFAQTGKSINANIFNILNLIPEGMTFNDDNNSIKDVFGSNITFHYGLVLQADGSKQEESYIIYNEPISNNKISSEGFAICQNTLTVLKEHYNNISTITLAIDDKGFKIYGYLGCPDYSICLKDLSVKDIEKVCYAQNVEELLEIIIYLHQ